MKPGRKMQVRSVEQKTGSHWWMKSQCLKHQKVKMQEELKNGGVTIATRLKAAHIREFTIIFLVLQRESNPKLVVAKPFYQIECYFNR